MEPLPDHVLATLQRSAAMIDHKATLPVEAGVVIRMTMELEQRRQADADESGGPFS